MTVEQAIIEAYRRGAAAMYDMGRGGLSHNEAWQRICLVASPPPNVRDLLEQFQAPDVAGEVTWESLGHGIIDWPEPDQTYGAAD